MRALTVVVAAAAAVTSACASAPFPEELTQSVNRSIGVEQLRADPTGSSARVILGGEILSTLPKTGSTEIEILSRPLDRGDVPERTDVSAGRFLARTPEFLDPAIYARGRRITVLGTAAGSDERMVGDRPYTYPVVDALRIKLWPREGPWVGGEYPPVPLDTPLVPVPR